MQGYGLRDGRQSIELEDIEQPSVSEDSSSDPNTPAGSVQVRTILLYAGAGAQY
jgi:hypothetical protein